MCRVRSHISQDAGDSSGSRVRAVRCLRPLMPEYASRRIYGAVAYLKAYQESDVRAERLGLFVIRVTGSSASITNRKEFTPRTFGPRSTAPSRR